MEPLIRKIFGWVLLLAGVAIISYCIYLSYNIFTAKTEVPQIFKAEQVQMSTSTPAKKGATQDIKVQAEEMAQKVIGEQFAKMLPADFLPKLFNLLAWSIFAGILILGGSQIAGLGIKLIR